MEKYLQITHLWQDSTDFEKLNMMLVGGWVIVATHMDEEGQVLYILGDPA